LGSTLATSALFLLIEPMSREEGGIAAILALTADAYGLDEREEDRQPEEGIAIPGTLTVLGLCFGIFAMVLAGLPPLPGFIGKFGILRGLLGSTIVSPGMSWAFIALLLLAGFATLIGLVRIGIQTFWASDGEPPRVFAMEFAPILMLVLLLLVLTVKADAAMRYMQQTANALLQPSIYAHGVLGAPRAAENGAGEEEGE